MKSSCLSRNVHACIWIHSFSFIVYIEISSYFYCDSNVLHNCVPFSPIYHEFNSLPPDAHLKNILVGASTFLQVLTDYTIKVRRHAILGLPEVSKKKDIPPSKVNKGTVFVHLRPSSCAPGGSNVDVHNSAMSFTLRAYRKLSSSEFVQIPSSSVCRS